ncbi:hypothetical protein ANME2D_01367 [Candidatus Methanoperedens nitroreducens]|uniref:Ferritin-like domain-containing protein n=1 Tax=Candidatus Methanoperedens nitratireducens TaxID=1392998 RepID=A0A062V1H7_9EURY|nr:hypothetical protein [Candidatus Methanoperedens nitroreducens]KCZ72926.1 hypothetical protein ANME2D_01367 [Candidatus Methanoperedens nitroreducens]MDJ1423146.1 hypothetical protein [Candidatus Methanoperedens sp.]
MTFKPFEEEGTLIEDQFMNWNKMIVPPYDKNSVDAYTRTRVILMNGIENNSVLTSHAIARMIDNDEIKRQLALIRRVDSQQQQTVNWLTPANQSVVETTIGYEQLAVDLTANLARNEPDDYFRQVLDFALIEDFDHLFRYGCLMEILENKDPSSITQGRTEVKPGRPTEIEHRHPYDEMREHFNKDTASIKTKMNYHTIVSAEQQTELFYKSHGFMYGNDLARKLYAEIAEIEEQHVSQYELVGDPNETPLERMALIQLNEAYNYYCCAQTEPDERIRGIWEEFMSDEITHFIMCNELMQKFEKRDIGDILRADTIKPLIVLEPNKDYVNHVIDTQVDLQPYNMRFVRTDELPSDWPSFAFREEMNAGGVPSEDVVKRAEKIVA